jgi:ribosomal-protein-alanine N-acetyltransferase
VFSRLTQENETLINEVQKLAFGTQIDFFQPFFQGLYLEDELGLLAYVCGQVVFETGDLDYFWIRPSHRQAGLGSKLLSAFIQLVKEAGAERLLLEVRESNLAARRLYEKAGFEIISERKNYYPDGEKALINCLELGDFNG